MASLKSYTLSIIIPVYHEPSLNDCLKRIDALAGSSSAEVIVVDGGGGSSLRNVDSSLFSFFLVTKITRPGRGHQLKTGAKLASAPKLVFLHADTVLRFGALGEITGILEHHPAGAFDLYIRTNSYYIKSVAVIATIRSRMTRIPYGDQVHFFRSDVYRDLGGYRDVAIMEDVDLMGRLKHRGNRIEYAKSFAVNPDRRWRKEGSVRRTLLNWTMMLLYRSGVTPLALSRHYLPHHGKK